MAWLTVRYNDKTRHRECECTTTAGRIFLKIFHFLVSLILPFAGAFWDAYLTHSKSAKGFLTPARIHQVSAIGSLLVFLALAITMPVLIHTYSVSTLIAKLHFSLLMNVAHPVVPLMLLTIWLPCLLTRMFIATTMSCCLAPPAVSQMGASTRNLQSHPSTRSLSRAPSQRRLATKKISRGRIVLGFLWQSMVGLNLEKYITTPGQRRRASEAFVARTGNTPLPLASNAIEFASRGRVDHHGRRLSAAMQQPTAAVELTPSAPTQALFVPEAAGSAIRYAAPPPTLPFTFTSTVGGAHQGAGVASTDLENASPVFGSSS